MAFGKNSWSVAPSFEYVLVYPSKYTCSEGGNLSNKSLVRLLSQGLLAPCSKYVDRYPVSYIL